MPRVTDSSSVLCRVSGLDLQIHSVLNLVFQNKCLSLSEQIVGGGSGILVRTPPGRLPLEVYRVDPEPAGGIIDLIWRDQEELESVAGNKKSRIFSQPAPKLLRAFSYRFI